MTTVAQIEKYRTTHKILAPFAMIAFAISLASISFLTLDSVLIGIAFMIAAIVLKVFESKAKAKEKETFESGLEEVLEKYFKANDYYNGVKLRLRSKKRFKYFVDFYQNVDAYELEKVINKYANETGTKIKFEVRRRSLMELIEEIFSD